MLSVFGCPSGCGLRDVRRRHAVATPPDSADPELRLWLRADDLTGDVGSEVTEWEDASLYATIFAPPGPRVVGGI